jgi:hypothetical protein
MLVTKMQQHPHIFILSNSILMCRIFGALANNKSIEEEMTVEGMEYTSRLFNSGWRVIVKWCINAHNQYQCYEFDFNDSCMRSWYIDCS